MLRNARAGAGCNRYSNRNLRHTSRLAPNTGVVGLVSTTQEASVMTTLIRSLVAIAAVGVFASPALAGPPSFAIRSRLRAES